MHVSDVWHHQAGFVGEEGHQNGEFLFLLNHIKAIGFLGHLMLSLVGFFCRLLDAATVSANHGCHGPH